VEALAGNFEEKHGSRGADVEGVHLAKDWDGEKSVAFLPDEAAEAAAFGPEDDADRPGIIKFVPERFLSALGADEPEAFSLEIVHCPGEVWDTGDLEVLRGPGRNPDDRIRYSDRSPLRKDNAVRPGALSAAKNRAQVLGVFNFVEKDEKREPGTGQDVVEIAIFFGPEN